MNKTYVSKRRRGFFGWLFLLIFLAFQALMILMVVANGSAVSAVNQEAEVACEGDQICEDLVLVGAGIGAGMVAGIGWFVWMLGTVILGLLVLFTRGKTVTYEVAR